MTRVLLIGLDGADPTLAARWMAEGRLPNLTRLARLGAWTPLRGVEPPITYPAWASCVTGVNPGRHGMIDFTEMVPGRYAVRFLNNADRDAPALWNILSDAGKRVCVLGVPGTYPPEPVNGIMMSGFDSPVADGIDPSFVWPREMYPRVRPWRFAEMQEHRITPTWYGPALRSLEQKIATKTEVARELIADEPWDFFMLVFGEADTASHHFWPLEDTASPRHDPAIKAPVHPIRRIYELLDSAVGRLVETAGEDVLVLVVSDHGFGGAHIKTVHLNNYLAEQDWLQFRGSNTSRLKRAALRWLPARGRGALFRRFRAIAERAESRSRFGGIDWGRTRAWSDELDYFPALRLNLAGREPEGIVPPDAYRETVDALCALLEDLPAVARARPRDTIYSGPHTARAPDIIIEPAWESGYRFSWVRARGGAVIETLPPGKRFGGKEQGCGGVHRNPALLVMNRPLGGEAPGLLDIAPTVLAWLGVAGPPMEGSSLLAGMDGATASAPSNWTPPSGNPYTEREEALLEARMRSLGYYE